MTDGTVVRTLLKEAVCIKEAPHNVVSPGRLENEGLCAWDGSTAPFAMVERCS